VKKIWTAAMMISSLLPDSVFALFSEENRTAATIYSSKDFV